MNKRARAPLQIEQVWAPIPNSSQEFALDSRCHHTLFHGTRGPGKALRLNCPIPTPSGWKMHGDLKPGDLVFGVNGSPVKVIKSFFTQYKNVYKLTFNDETSLEACGEHLWQGTIDRGFPKNWRTFNTLEIKELLEKGYPVRLPARPALEYTNSSLPIDPYLLGLWVGDGSASIREIQPTGKRTKVRKRYTVEFGTNDLELLEFVQSQGFSVRRRVGDFTWLMGKEKHKDALIKLGLFGMKSATKFIPEEILLNSIDVRLAFLQGLADTDGTPRPSAGATISTCSRRLAENVLTLVRSLGGCARINEYTPKEGQRQKLIIFNVYFSLPDLIPFRLTRKIARFKHPVRMGWFCPSVKKVELVEKSAPVSCIKVEGSLYVAGSDFIVTHNTETQLMRFRRRVGIGYGPFWRGIIFDQEYKSLDDLIAKSQRWFPLFQDGARFRSSQGTLGWYWPTGEELLFRQIKTTADYSKYHGHEYPFIGFNELTKYHSSECYDMAQSLNRTSFRPEDYPIFINGPYFDEHGVQILVPESHPNARKILLPEIPLEMFSTTNPWGAGRNWVKDRFIDCAQAGEVVKIETEVFNPRTQKDEIFVTTQVAIFGSWRENIYLTPQYIAGLKNEADENRRMAWFGGSWDVIAGGALGDLWRSKVHQIPRFKIPRGWRLDRAFDWGSTHPFSVGWFAEANGETATIEWNGDEYHFCPPPGTLVQIYEWYGTKKIGTNKGLKMSPKDIAEGILAREALLRLEGWICGEVHPGPADNQIRDVVRTDIETIEDEMIKVGVSWTKSDKSAGSRRNGLQLVRDRLEATNRNEGPGIYFMSNCRGSINTLPTLPRDEKKPDDVDTTAEDHAYDMVRYRVLAAGAYQPPENFKVGFAI